MLDVINLLVDYIEEKHGISQREVVASWQNARERGFSVDKQSGMLFEEIVEVAVKPGYTIEYGVLEVIIQIGLMLQQRSFIRDSWWFTLVGLKVSRKGEGAESLVKVLLNYGMSRENIHNWKAIMIILEVFYQQADIRRIVIQQIRDVYNLRFGEILDSLNSFQLANYLIELLVNCFPKKHDVRATVSTAPKLWNDAEKVKSFFSDELYPYRAKHGEEAIIQFILKRFGNFFTNFGPVKKALYTVGKSNKTRSLSKRQSYVQVIHQSFFFWDGEGLFLDINPKTVDVVKDLKDTLKMTLTDSFPKCVLSPHSTWLMTMNRATIFQFQTTDPKVTESIWNATKLPKISEVQTYISLRFPSSYDDGIIESSIQGSHVDNADENIDMNQTESSFPMGQVARINQMVTPDKADVTIEKEIIPESIPSSSQHPETPKKMKQSVFDRNIQHDEQSPLAIAQKRKMIRATSKTLEVLKEEFRKKEQSFSQEDLHEVISEDVHESLNNLKIAKFESKTKQKQKNINCKKVTDIFKSIKNPNVSVLDDIFALPLPKGKIRKNPKAKQSKLNNFQPVVYVPSQDIPAKSKLVAANNNRLTVKRRKNIPDSTDKKRKRITNNDDIFALSEAEEQDSILQPASVKRVTRSAKNAVEIHQHAHENEHTPEQRSALEHPIAETEVSKTIAPSEINSADTSGHNENSVMAESSHTDISMVVPSMSKGQIPILQASFTNQLQEQIYHSVMNFSNELSRKISLINGEMNKKIIHELSEKYKVMFKELQSSFQNDVEKITGFVGEIKDMLHLPENELLKLIRDKQFHS